MKKIGKMAVVVLLAVCMFSACGRSGKSDTTKTETVTIDGEEYKCIVVEPGKTVKVKAEDATNVSDDGQGFTFF